GEVGELRWRGAGKRLHGGPPVSGAGITVGRYIQRQASSLLVSTGIVVILPGARLVSFRTEGRIVSDVRESAGGSPSSTPTSRSLLDRVRAGDGTAWDRLVGLYAPLVLHWCRRRDLPEQDIADVFQEVFLAVATHIGQFRKQRPADTFR